MYTAQSISITNSIQYSCCTRAYILLIVNTDIMYIKSSQVKLRKNYFIEKHVTGEFHRNIYILIT